MSAHIGSIIKKVLEEKKISPSELAARLSVHPGSISRLFNYKDMHSSQLAKISQAVGHDFFKYFSQDIRVERSESEKKLEEMRKELDLLRKENGYLKQINELLNKQNPTSHEG